MVAVAFTGCGLGKGVVEKVSVATTQEGELVYVDLKADLKKAGFTLPPLTLPLVDPKRPERKLGEIVTNGYTIQVRVNANEVVKFPVADGSKLPNGDAVPVSLSGGQVPIAIPVLGSNSRVYFAMNSNQIMIGTAVTILKEDRLNLPVNLFFPFTANAQITGTAGFFLGALQGIGVFALYEKPAVTTSAMARIATATSTVEAPRISIRSEAVSNAKIRRLERTANSLSGELSLD